MISKNERVSRLISHCAFEDYFDNQKWASETGPEYCRNSKTLFENIILKREDLNISKILVRTFSNPKGEFFSVDNPIFEWVNGTFDDLGVCHTMKIHKNITGLQSFSYTFLLLSEKFDAVLQFKLLFLFFLSSRAALKYRKKCRGLGPIFSD